MGQIFKLQGFDIEVAQVLQGQCVTHEVDVVATLNKSQQFIECKFYQSEGKNANVQVPLYIRSRVDDIIKMRADKPEFSGYSFSGGVVTNTRFTSDAMAYGLCSGLHLLSWDFPVGNGLKELIDKYNIYPITVLTQLTVSAKQQLMEGGIVTCAQIKQNPNVLDSLSLDKNKRQRLMEEIGNLCNK